MDKNTLKNYIKNKYSLSTNDRYSKYIKLDAMIEFYDLIKDNTTILKGALNLFVNFDYERDELTKDTDISLINISPGTFTKRIKKSFNHGLYEYSFIDSKDITESMEYKGIKATINFKVIDLRITDNFSIDFSVEELSEYRDGTISYYSIERSMADKVASMFRLGETNTRKKDFIDFEHFYKTIDSEQFKKDLIKVIEARGTTIKHIEKFITILKEKLSEYDLKDIHDPLLSYATYALEILNRD